MGTLEEQHQRTIELIEHLLDKNELTLHGLLYLLYDTQSADHIKRLAEIALTRPSRLCRQAEASEPEQPALRRGMIIKAKRSGRIAMVLDPIPDSGGDIRVACPTDIHRIYFQLSHGYEILGRITEDGDFRPA